MRSADSESRRASLLRILAVALGSLSLVLNIGGLVFAYRNTVWLGGAVDWSGLVWELWPTALAVVGVVVAAARPRVLVGWGLLAAGLSIEVITLGGAYGGWAQLTGSTGPLSDLAIWSGLAASGVFTSMAPLVVSRLPSGRPDTPAARFVSRASWILGTALILWWGFGGEVLSVNTLSGGSLTAEPLSSPFVRLHLSRSITGGVTSALTLGLIGCFFCAIYLVLRRWRRAPALERAQLRWLAGGLLVLPIVAALQLLAQGLADVRYVDLIDTLLLVAGLGAIPVSIAVSVLKFHLFEIDRLVSRTVTYLVVALVLGSVYAILATLPSTLVLGKSGGAPSWLVAGSTLVIAAAFSPVRRKVQRVVDRRFNRSRYDAELVVERFSIQVRELTEVRAITSGLTGAVLAALQPAEVAVWWAVP